MARQGPADRPQEAAHLLDAQAPIVSASLPIGTLAPASKESAWQVCDLNITGVFEPDSRTPDLVSLIMQCHLCLTL